MLAMKTRATAASNLAAYPLNHGSALSTPRATLLHPLNLRAPHTLQ